MTSLLDGAVRSGYFWKENPSQINGTYPHTQCYRPPPQSIYASVVVQLCCYRLQEIKSCWGEKVGFVSQKQQSPPLDGLWFWRVFLPSMVSFELFLHQSEAPVVSLGLSLKQWMESTFLTKYQQLLLRSRRTPWGLSQPPLAGPYTCNFN